MSEQNDFTSDPRLTAFALGELEGAERAEIEALVARDGNAKRFVDEIRATAAFVTTELATAGGPALTAAQRAAIAAKAIVAKPVRSMRPIYWIATAASVAAAVVGVSVLRGSDEKETAYARSTQHEETALKDRVVAVSNKAREAGARFNETEKHRAAAEGDLEQVDGRDYSKIYSEGGGGGGGGTRTAGTAGANGKEEFESQDGPVNPNEVLVPVVGGAGGGDVRTEDPNGATGGTSVGAGKTRTITSAAWNGHFAGRAGAGGRGGGGVGGGKGGAAPPKMRAPQKPQEAAGPQTPGGPGANADADELRRFASLGYVGGDTGGGTASYSHIEDNPFRLVKDAPLSTFGVDVDTASYSNIRRFLTSRQLPPPGAVRIEEMVNYFPYDYAPPSDGRPFAVRVDVAGCPWKTDHRLVRVGIKGKVVATAARPAANLVFLLDVSGSMSPQNRLPLILQSMKMLVGQLEARDRVAIAVYAGESGLALPSTSCEDKGKILAALDALHAGGSTNGASGIQLAYDVAAANRIDGGINRVILATDGDFNVGVTDESSLVKLVQEKAKAGTFLSVLGVGDDNFKDSTMEMLADRGNGNYSYIDTLKEGEKVLVGQTNGTLVTIAKDVKIQVEFNPAQVGSYRLIGYEDRVLAAEDFKNDKKDAGEIGAGHTVTALYEVVPPGVLATETGGVDPLKYQPPQAPAPAIGTSRELLTVKLRWKEPNADVSTPMEVPVVDEGVSYSAASPDFKFAASVAAFGMVLRNSPNRGNISIPAIVELATEGAANDPNGYRAEFVTLLKTAAELGAK